MELPLTEQGLLAAYGCDRRGGFLVIDELAVVPWRRRRFAVRSLRFTLAAREGRFCTGRHHLERGVSEPCPERSALRGEAFEQCGPCFRATGFNPAFYFANEVSPQQHRRNLEPHCVYLAHFGGGTIKVGMTHARRGVDRLLEQGARVGVLLARFGDAYRARRLEEAIARGLSLPEAVRPAKKRALLEVPFSAAAALAELDEQVQRVREIAPEVELSPEPVELDEYYGGAAVFERPLVDLSESEPLAISGQCVGMIGDVLVMAQSGRHYALSVSALVSRSVRLSADEQPNRKLGQLGLPF